MRKECLPIILALERLRQGIVSLKLELEQGPFSKANDYKQEEQQWLLFMNHSLREALGYELSANHHRLWKDAAYILALEPGLSEVQ